MRKYFDNNRTGNPEDFITLDKRGDYFLLRAVEEGSNTSKGVAVIELSVEQLMNMARYAQGLPDERPAPWEDV